MWSWRPWLPRRPSRTARIGRRGERVAARWLTRQRYVIRARRWRTPAGEVDLLAERGRRLWLVEVKSTEQRGGPPPTTRLRRTQRLRLCRAARWTAAQRGARGRQVGVLVLGVRLRAGRSPLVFQTVVYDTANRR
ncbi:MAG: YraN family protein [Planctomycetota bacterium]|nr:YraN family protein [Planctomycetota bacterium]